MRLTHINSSPKNPGWFNSWLLNDLRVPIKIAQEQLGHASVTTTLNVCTRVVEASHRRAIEAVEERLLVDLDSNGLESKDAQRAAETGSALRG